MKKLLVLVLGLGFLGVGLAIAAEKSANKELLKDFYKNVINKHSVEAADDYIAEGFVEHNPEPKQNAGLEGVKDVLQMYFAAFPDLNVKSDFMVEEGDRVASRLTITGTQKGEFMGMKGTGKKIKITGLEVLNIKGGKIAERWADFDMLSVMQQLGMMNPASGKCPMDKACPMGKDGKCPMTKDCPKGKCPMMDKDGKKKDEKKEEMDEDDDDN